jgi:hypothetical protein
LGLGALIGPTGCGGTGKTDVSGTIKVRGQPPKVTGIQVMFVHPDGTMVSAPVAEDGAYRAEGVPPGEVKVCFAFSSQETAQMGAPVKAGAGGHLKKPGMSGDEQVAVKTPGTPAPKTNPIPAPLRDTSTSKLTVTVEAGKPNTFDYDIKE